MSAGATYTPGAWLALVSSSSAALVDPALPGACLEQLWRAVRDGSGVGAMLDAISQWQPATPPVFAVAALDGSGVHVVASGDMQVSAQLGHGGERHVTGASRREDRLAVGDTLWLVRPGERADGVGLPIGLGVVLADVVAWRPAVPAGRAVRGGAESRVAVGAGRRSAGLGSHPRRRYGAADWSTSPHLAGDAERSPGVGIDTAVPDVRVAHVRSTAPPTLRPQPAAVPAAAAAVPAEPGAPAAAAAPAATAPAATAAAAPAAAAPAATSPAPTPAPPSTPAPAPARRPTPPQGPSAPPRPAPTPVPAPIAPPAPGSPAPAAAPRPAGTPAPVASPPTETPHPALEPASPVGAQAAPAPKPAVRAAAAAAAGKPAAPAAKPATARSAGRASASGPGVGVLVFADGSEIVIDGSVIIGRSPTQTDPDRPARLVTVRGEGRGVSRNHLRIDVRDDGAYAVDLASRNGSAITPPEGERVRLEAGTPYRLGAGSRLTVADLTCEFRAV